MQNQLRYSRKRRKVDRESLIQMLRRHLDAKQPIRDEGLLVGGLLDALLARYGASDRKLKRYEQRYLELARDLVQIIYKEVRTKTRSRFQDRLWEGEQGVLNARLVIRHLIQRMARWKLDHVGGVRHNIRYNLDAAACHLLDLLPSEGSSLDLGSRITIKSAEKTPFSENSGHQK